MDGDVPKPNQIHRRVFKVLKEHPKGLEPGDQCYEPQGDDGQRQKDEPLNLLNPLQKRILGFLQASPDGLTIQQIRTLGGFRNKQEHLTRRVRSLRRFFDLPLVWRGGRALYVLGNPRLDVTGDSGAVGGKLRAQILHDAHGQCQMCGRTIVKDNVKLQIDHKIPLSWGGSTVGDNLWAICQLCNGGKRDFFETFNIAQMKDILAEKSVYSRIMRTLSLSAPLPTESWMLRFVANFDDYQEDWQRRLRELRGIGYPYTVERYRSKAGSTLTRYAIPEPATLSSDHVERIRAMERRRRNRIDTED